MISFDVPGVGVFELSHLVLDFNGTLAQDGALLEGVAKRLFLLSEQLAIHVVTADTFGKARLALDRLPVDLKIIAAGAERAAKSAFVDLLGPASVAAMGNGANDSAMLAAAAISIAVIGPEGAARMALDRALIVVRDPCEGLDLFLEPKRIVATLRR